MIGCRTAWLTNRERGGGDDHAGGVAIILHRDGHIIDGYIVVFQVVTGDAGADRTGLIAIINGVIDCIHWHNHTGIPVVDLESDTAGRDPAFVGIIAA